MFGWGHICIYDLTYMRNHKYHLQFLQTSGFLIRGSARTWAHSQSSSASPPRTQLPSISGAETETANPTSYQSESFVRQTRQTRIFGSCWRVSWSLFHSRAGKYELTQISGKPSFYNVQMKIRISNVSEDDFGLWRCLAKNSQGETSGEIKLYGMSMYDTSNYEAIAPAPLDHLQFTLEERKRMLEQHCIVNILLIAFDASHFRHRPILTQKTRGQQQPPSRHRSPTSTHNTKCHLVGWISWKYFCNDK